MHRICVLVTDAFSADVGEQVVRSDRSAVVSPDIHRLLRVDTAAVPPARAYLLPRSRPTADELRLDDVVGRWRAFLLPIVMEHPLLRIGPLVQPGHEGCVHCYHARVRQHSRFNAVNDALAGHYRRNPDAGPAGMLPTIVALAADVAVGVVRTALTGATAEAGVVRHLDVTNLQLRRSNVVGVHGCPRCGLGTDERTRSHAALRPALAGLWTEGA